MTSDWVMSEAGRAHADQKLIPVKARGLEYAHIPPPFDNQHTENLDAHENILAAVQGQLAKGPVPPPLWKKVRYETLSWMGIVGGAISLLSNLRNFMDFSGWLNALYSKWDIALTIFWSKFLFFIPILKADAIIVTIAVFFCVNIFLSTRARQDKFNGALFICATILIILTFTAGAYFPHIVSSLKHVI